MIQNDPAYSLELLVRKICGYNYRDLGGAICADFFELHPYVAAALLALEAILHKDIGLYSEIVKVYYSFKCVDPVLPLSSPQYANYVAALEAIY